MGVRWVGGVVVWFCIVYLIFCVRFCFILFCSCFVESVLVVRVWARVLRYYERRFYRGWLVGFCFG